MMVGVTWSRCPTIRRAERLRPRTPRSSAGARLGLLLLGRGHHDDDVHDLDDLDDQLPAAPPVTTTTSSRSSREVVLSQAAPAGTVLKPGTPVDFTMHGCPQ